MAGLKYRLFFLLTSAIFLVDQATKAFVAGYFHLGETLSVVPGLFNLTYIQNTGVAFGIFARGNELTRVLLLILPTIVCLGLFVFYLRLPKDEVFRRISVSLILGGAISNLIDRFRLGYVVDFLDFHWQRQAHYPSFNAADAFICTGVFMFFLASRAADKKGAVVNV